MMKTPPSHDDFTEKLRLELVDNFKAPLAYDHQLKPVDHLVGEVITRYQRRGWLRQGVIVAAGSLGGVIGLGQFLSSQAVDHGFVAPMIDPQIEAQTTALVSVPDQFTSIIIDRLMDIMSLVMSLSQSSILFWVSLLFAFGIMTLALMRPVDEW